MSKRFLIILAVIILGFIGIVVVSKNKDKASQNGSSSSQSATSNHTIGNSSRGITLIEYGDFQCPSCGGVEPILEQVREKYKNDIVFQYRNYPLTQLHQNAMAAHRAAEAASIQGKFWEMHDLLYQTQSSWSQSHNVGQIFEDFATQIGLNIDKYKTDLTSSAVNDVINADIKSGQDFGATGTPTYIFNGSKLSDNPTSLDAFSKLIDEAIAKKSNNQ